MTVLHRRFSLPALAAAAALCTFGQPCLPAHAQVQIMVTPVKVTPEQQKKLDALHAALARQIGAIGVDKTRSKAQKEALVKKITAKYIADVAAVYTPAQRAQMAKEGAMARQAWLQQHQAASEAHGRETEYNRLKQQALTLGAQVNATLTADQKKKIADAQADAQQQTAAINADKTLTDDQREKKLADVEQQLEGKVNGILTADQRAKFAKIQKIMDRQAQLLLGAAPSSSTTTTATAP